jgi:hypothetical protein
VRDVSLMRWGLIPSWAQDSSATARIDQRQVGTSGHETRVPGSIEISQMPDLEVDKA